MTKFIFVTGGVCSGLGKGITAAALGRLLKQRGLKVAAQKLDPYMNVDPGTMCPYQHGEVFVTDDGTEADLDLGHYERIIDENLTKNSTMTSGIVYSRVLERERAGDYNGGTVQIIPHVTGEIKDFVYAGAAKGVDVLIVEIGGTVGDIEAQPFLEAIRQISLEQQSCLFVHVTLIPYLKATGEHKSKPTQHSVKELRSIGITPNIIIARADEPMGADIKQKIALFCNVKEDCVIENITLPSLYEAPIMLHENGLDNIVCRELGLELAPPDLGGWRAMLSKISKRQKTVSIAIVGTYVKLPDAYLSIIESLNHAGLESGTDVKIRWINSENLCDLTGIDGMIIPGAFNEQGIEGKIAACKHARLNDIPLLGICLGMQALVLEYARNVCGLEGANDVTADGVMRRGAYPCKIVPNSLLSKIYNSEQVSERHRHRFELNNSYREILAKNGMLVSGTSPDGHLAEAVELAGKRFYIGVKFHPEFKSRPNRAHPLFLDFVRSTI